jgi:hypothetical protein
MSDFSRLKILEMLEKGTISAEQAIDLLNSSSSAASLPEESPQPETGSFASTPVQPIAPPQVEPVAADLPGQSGPAVFPTSAAEEKPPQAAEVTPDPFRDRAQAWRRWWWFPLWGGVGITLVGALLMYLAWDRSGFGFWFACTWFPFLFGVFVMALSWASRTARWLHVRIHRQPGDGPRNIAISFPLPLRLAAWFVRTFNVRVPKLERTSLDELILALEHTTPDAPFFVEVQDDDDGERVEVYIG